MTGLNFRFAGGESEHPETIRRLRRAAERVGEKQVLLLKARMGQGTETTAEQRLREAVTVYLRILQDLNTYETALRRAENCIDWIKRTALGPVGDRHRELEIKEMVWIGTYASKQYEVFRGVQHHREPDTAPDDADDDGLPRY